MSQMEGKALAENLVNLAQLMVSRRLLGVWVLLTGYLLAACSPANKLIDSNSLILAKMQWQKPVQLEASEAIEVAWKARGFGDHPLKDMSLQVGVAVIPKFYKSFTDQEPRIFEKLSEKMKEAVFLLKTEPVVLQLDAEGVYEWSGEVQITPEMLASVIKDKAEELDTDAALVVLWSAIDVKGAVSEIGHRVTGLSGLVHGGRPRKRVRVSGPKPEAWAKGAKRGEGKVPDEVSKDFAGFSVSYRFAEGSHYLYLGERFRLLPYQ